MKLGNPSSIVKRAMNVMGYPVGPVWRPVSGMNSKIDEELLKVP
jgi:4-hydroxy-tetrahydrodipicolinate synthase